jgi:hypothetical protein
MASVQLSGTGTSIPFVFSQIPDIDNRLPIPRATGISLIRYYQLRILVSAETSGGSPSSFGTARTCSKGGGGAAADSVGDDAYGGGGGCFSFKMIMACALLA